MMFCSCARLRADVNASVYILHNLHHTSRIEIYIQHTADNLFMTNYRLM